MVDLDETKFAWEQAQRAIDLQRDDARWALEKQKAAWDNNPVLRLFLPVALLLLAASQGALAIFEYQLHVQHEQREQRDKGIEALHRAETIRLDRERAERERGNQNAQLVEMALKYRPELESPDPETKCKLLRYFSLSPVYDQVIPQFKVGASACDNPAEFLAAVRDFKLENLREGAPDGFVRRDPTSKALYQETCSIATRNLHGQGDGIVSNEPVCALRSAPSGAVIYKVEYACVDPRCGWSYNPNPNLGYAMDASISSGGKQISWKRRWDGDPHTESYVMYYQIPKSEAKF